MYIYIYIMQESTAIIFLTFCTLEYSTGKSGNVKFKNNFYS